MKLPRCWILIAILGWSCPALVKADALKTIADRLARGVAELPGHRVAVLPFQYPDGGMSSGSMLVSDRITARLASRRNVQVVERAFLSRLLEEMRLEITGVMPATTIPRWGSILAVDGVVTGTLVDLDGDRTEVHARLVQLDTGLVLSAETVTIKRTWDDPPVVPVREPLWTAPLSTRDPSGDGSEKWVAAPATMILPDIDNVIRVPVLSPSMLPTIRHLYEESPDPLVRARALYAMGIILERRGLPAEAAQAYRRLIDEFPDNARLRSDATGRLWATRQFLR